mmetsp:Transcript_35501/g.54312  ORF Transcript_35501/g.54312 Transcript_35501/m.54312 type:complete len:125 (+) Transcript_35501:1514-1888(+)
MRQRELQALEFCQSYAKERAWMAKNRLLFYNLPEEQKFQELITQFRFKQKLQITENEAQIKGYLLKKYKRLKLVRKSSPTQVLKSSMVLSTDDSPKIESARLSRAKTLPSRISKLVAIPEEEDS